MGVGFLLVPVLDAFAQVEVGEHVGADAVVGQGACAFVGKVRQNAGPLVGVPVLRHDRVGHDFESDGAFEFVRGGGLAKRHNPDCVGF